MDEIKEPETVTTEDGYTFTRQPDGSYTDGDMTFDNYEKLMRRPTHTKECNTAFAAHEKAVSEYEAKWPNYCRKCKGWSGFWSSYDPSPSGVALAPGSMLDFDTCPECWDKGKCARCSGHVDTDAWDEGDVCPGCGFIFGGDDGLPAEPECWCGYEED